MVDVDVFPWIGVGENPESEGDFFELDDFAGEVELEEEVVLFVGIEDNDDGSSSIFEPGD
jgi:hypothetical protein